VHLALHHRVVSLTAMSELKDKLLKWSEKFGAYLTRTCLRKE